jgi:hypothetical protein
MRQSAAAWKHPAAASIAPPAYSRSRDSADIFPSRNVSQPLAQSEAVRLLSNVTVRNLGGERKNRKPFSRIMILQLKKRNTRNHSDNENFTQ